MGGPQPDCIGHVCRRSSRLIWQFSAPFGDLFVYSDSERDLETRDRRGVPQPVCILHEALTCVSEAGRMVVHCTDLPSRKGRDGFIGLQDSPGI